MTAYEQRTDAPWRSRRKRFRQYLRDLEPSILDFEPLPYPEHVSWNPIQGKNQPGAPDYTAGVPFAVQHIAAFCQQLQQEYTAPSQLQPGRITEQWRRMYKSRVLPDTFLTGDPSRLVKVHTVVNYGPQYRLIGGLRANQWESPLTFTFAEDLVLYDTAGRFSNQLIILPKLKTAAQSILLWLEHHDYLITVLNSFAEYSNACSDRQRERYGIESAKLTLLLHVVASFRSAIQSHDLDENTPWAWQEPLVVQTVVEAMDNRERVHYLMDGVQRVFRESAQHTLQER